MEPNNSNNRYPSSESANSENAGEAANALTSFYPDTNNVANSPSNQTTSAYPNVADFTSPNTAYPTQLPIYAQSTQLHQTPPRTTAKGKSNAGLFLTLIVFAVVLLVAGTGLLVWFYQDNQIQQLKTNQAQTVATADSKITAAVQQANTANSQLTAVAQMQQATSAARVNATATAMAPATATARIWQPTVEALDKQGKQLYYGSGILNITEPNHFVTHSSSTELQNFVAKATFQNPSDPAEHNWDYGFLLRHTGTDREFRLYVLYDGYWTLKLANGKNSDGTVSTSTIMDGYITNWNHTTSATNQLSIYVKGDKGSFFVNNQLVSSLDLVSKLDAGDVEVGTGFQLADEETKKIISYTDFSVYSLDSAN